jgi:hypothetical protein
VRPASARPGGPGHSGPHALSDRRRTASRGRDQCTVFPSGRQQQLHRGTAEREGCFKLTADGRLSELLAPNRPGNVGFERRQSGIDLVCQSTRHRPGAVLGARRPGGNSGPMQSPTPVQDPLAGHQGSPRAVGAQRMASSEDRGCRTVSHNEAAMIDTVTLPAKRFHPTCRGISGWRHVQETAPSPWQAPQWSGALCWRRCLWLTAASGRVRPAACSD